jgi:hypothetical protein
MAYKSYFGMWNEFSLNEIGFASLCRRHFTMWSALSANGLASSILSPAMKIACDQFQHIGAGRQDGKLSACGRIQLTRRVIN